MTEEDKDEPPETVPPRRRFFKTALGLQNPDLIKMEVTAAGMIGAASFLAKYLPTLPILDPMIGEEELDHYPQIAASYKALCQRMGKTPYPVYVISSDLAGAATDPSTGKIAITTALITLLNDKELMAVLAHEMGHSRVQNKAAKAVGKTLTLFCTLHTASTLLTHLEESKINRRKFGRLLVLAGIGGAAGSAYYVWSLGENVTKGIGEVEADRHAMEYCDRQDIASALRKIEQYEQEHGMSFSAADDFVWKVRRSLVEGGGRSK